MILSAILWQNIVVQTPNFDLLPSTHDIGNSGSLASQTYPDMGSDPEDVLNFLLLWEVHQLMARTSDLPITNQARNQLSQGGLLETLELDISDGLEI